jgi:glutathione peroxidase-family protein
MRLLAMTWRGSPRLEYRPESSSESEQETMAIPNTSERNTNSQRFWTPSRLAITFVGVALVAALGFASCISNDETSNTATRTESARTKPSLPPLPANMEPPVVPQDLRDTKVETLDGESLSLSDYANKVLVVNIWATWCGPCRMEMPELVKINNEYKSRGLVVLGLATTYNEHNDPVHVKDYVRSQNVTYKIVWDNGSLAAPLVQLVNAAQVIPQSFVISRDGHIVRHFQGFSPVSTPQLMREAIEEALNDKGKA